MPTENPVADLSADRPLRSIKEDLLGRGQFALAMANALSGWRGDESLVMALYGAWGSGKSTVKNFVLEFLSKAENPLTVVEFNPWAWSGQDRLMTAFFQEVGLAIGEETEGEKRKEVASKWKKYAARLALGGSVFKFLKTATGVVGIPIMPVVADIASEMADKSSEFVAKAAEAAGEDGDEPLDKLKQSLAESLTKLAQPVLVVMDDVDRLSRDEIRLLFQLIKINADFPNVIFLLLFDRTVVEESLTGFTGSTGRAYLEKIVQVGFDLPDAGRSDLDAAFESGLEQILDRYGGYHGLIDVDRWPMFFHQGIRPFLKTMRDVRRFLSSFSFTIGLFFKDRTLEANLIDVLGVETLRMFEPAVYARIRENQDAFAIDAAKHWVRDQDQSKRREEINAAIEAASSEKKEAVRTMVEQLFPTFTRSFGPGFDDRWLRDLRICSPQIFPRYFLFGVPKDDVPQSLIDHIQEASGDLSAIREVLQDLSDSKALPVVLRRLQAYTDVLDLSNAKNFITALWDVGDHLSDRGGSFFDLGGSTGNAIRIVYHWLIREPDESVRGRILLEAVRTTRGLHLPVDTVSSETQRDAKQDGRVQVLLSGDALEEAKQICIEKIAAASKDGGLLGPRLSNYLWTWKRFAGAEGPQTYVAELTSSTAGSLHLLRGFLNRISSTTLTGVRCMRYEIRLASLEEFVPMARLEASLASIIGDDGSGDSGLKKQFDVEIDSFNRAVRRRAHGKSEDDPFFDDEDGPLVTK